MNNVLQRVSNYRNVDVVSYQVQTDKKTGTENDEKESLDLLSIRSNLDRILCKTDYLSFPAMEETCRAVRDVCCEKTVRVQIDVAQISVFENETVLYKERDERGIQWGDLTSQININADLIIIEEKLTTVLVNELLQMFSVNRTRARKFRCEEIVACVPDQLNKLLSKLGVKFFDSQHQLKKNYFSMSVFLTMNINAVYCNIDDSQLLCLKGEYLFMRNDSITAVGINKFLQQWRNGLREIQVFDLEYPMSIGSRDFDTIVGDLDANPIWTPDLHSTSMISYIPLNHFPEMMTDDPEHLYSLWRPEDISQILIIRINSVRIEIFKSESEVDFLQGYVKEYQDQLVFRQRAILYREGRRGHKQVGWTSVIFSLLFSVVLTVTLAHPLTTETLLTLLKQVF